MGLMPRPPPSEEDRSAAGALDRPPRDGGHAVPHPRGPASTAIRSVTCGGVTSGLPPLPPHLDPRRGGKRASRSASRSRARTARLITTIVAGALSVLIVLVSAYFWSS